jgi:hypothetical protein
MTSLLTSQNMDGGWPYQRGGPSWTEPTAYALLALIGQRPAVEPVARALRWLQASQRADGGWPPQASVRDSTWVTAVVALLGPIALGRAAHRNAITWLLRQTGEDTNLLMRARQFLMGDSPSHTFPGWPWFPGTSAWVTPTALSILALRKAAQLDNSPQIRARLDMGASYLLAHACSDGGWNYGAARALDYDASSYAETTGVALLALAGRHSAEIVKACGWAQSRLFACQSSEAESWLRLGLLAHGQLPVDNRVSMRIPRTVQNTALALLATAAAQGRNPFLE